MFHPKKVWYTRVEVDGTGTMYIVVYVRLVLTLSTHLLGTVPCTLDHGVNQTFGREDHTLPLSKEMQQTQLETKDILEKP